jgi:hypothetical protein
MKNWSWRALYRSRSTPRLKRLWSAFQPCVRLECLGCCRLAFHKAKKLYLSLSRSGKYQKTEAVSAIDALIEFRKREAEFRTHPHASVLFGFHFRGIETEFGPFERLATITLSIVSSASRTKSCAPSCEPRK